MTEIVTREEARQKGAKRFFTGKPCKRGHLSERWVIGHGQCIQCGRDNTKAWEKSNPEKAEIGAKRRQAKRPKRKRTPKMTESSRRWYAENKADRNVSVRAWQKSHPENLRAIKHRYRAKAKAGGSHSAEDIRDLMKIQKRKCAHPWCKRSLADGYHVDHRIPISAGGANDRSNLQLLCPTCNLHKSFKHPVDFAQQNGFLV